MPIVLPTSPEPCAPYGGPRIVSLRNDVTSLIGGNRQRNQRKGDHYRVRFQMPPLSYGEALEWRSLLSAGDTVVMTLPQPGVDPDPVGTPLVNGADQLGTTLVVDGLTPQLAIRKGQMLSIFTNGRYWTYGIDADVIADAAGAATLTLEVMIRTLHADNDPIELAEPKIEGFASVDDDSWTLDENGYIRLAFEIEERG
ncbi:hypothetical protein [Brevundimonas sp. LjRoot202]|uniref:hypothetical protein n=1 Tax=Brevundimonas sp. LjRoot202 TaxID=3342281 RepID=UPI003ECDD667